MTAAFSLLLSTVLARATDSTAVGSPGAGVGSSGDGDFRIPMLVAGVWRVVMTKKSVGIGGKTKRRWLRVARDSPVVMEGRRFVLRDV